MADELEGIVKEKTPEWSTVKIGNTVFTMHEMTIGQVKVFTIEFSKALDELKGITGVDELKELDMSKAIVLYTDKISGVVAKLWNVVFAYKNADYEPIDGEWVEANLKISTVLTVVKEIARLSRIEWLGPFLKSRLMETAGAAMQNRTVVN